VEIIFSSCKPSVNKMEFPYCLSGKKKYEREIVSLAWILHMDNFFVILLEE